MPWRLQVSNRHLRGVQESQKAQTEHLVLPVAPATFLRLTTPRTVKSARTPNTACMIHSSMAVIHNTLFHLPILCNLNLRIVPAYRHLSTAIPPLIPVLDPCQAPIISSTTLNPILLHISLQEACINLNSATVPRAACHLLTAPHLITLICTLPVWLQSTLSKCIALFNPAFQHILENLLMA